MRGILALPPGSGRKLRDPGHQARQAAQRNVERSAQHEQLPPEPKQELRRWQRLDELGRDVARVAVARAPHARLGAINEHHAAVFARERVRYRATNDTRADDRDRTLLLHSPNVYDPLSRHQDRSIACPRHSCAPGPGYFLPPPLSSTPPATLIFRQRRPCRRLWCATAFTGSCSWARWARTTHSAPRRSARFSRRRWPPWAARCHC